MKYKLLGPSGLKVSELCLGTMGFGTENNWGADLNETFAILDEFANAGGNFIDTANMYKTGTSEKFIGEYLQENDRDYFVVATKYSLRDNTTNPNASGNNRKNMMRSVEASLKRLNSGFIDVLYLHCWDDLTPVEEILRGLDDLISQGKVNYIAISDAPAWVVSKANTIAELSGWSQFIGLQIEYSLLARTPERELIPMAKHFGLTVLPWAPMAGGALTGKYLRGEKGRIKPDSNRLSERSNEVTREVVKIAEKLNIEAAHVALRWLMQKDFSCIPIVGATKKSQLIQNLKAVEISIPQEDIDHLDEISKIDLGFPGEFFKEDNMLLNNYGGFYNRIEKRNRC